mgnify:CR=1 FL=1
MLRRGARLLPQLARTAAPTDAAAPAAWPAASSAPGGSLGSACMQDVQQQQAWQTRTYRQQRRQSAAALPQPEYASDEDYQPHSSPDAQQQSREYHRRLQEMLEGTHTRSTTTTTTTSTSTSGGTSAAQRSAAWPTPQQVAERLRSGQGASCSSAAAPAPAPAEDPDSSDSSSSSGSLDWREVVAAARRHQEVSGAEMLTDTFG